MVDEPSVQRRLALLGEYVARLADLATLSAADYCDRRYEARYLVQASAQLCVDLANHVISSEGWPAARDQRDAFARLAEQGVVEPLLGQRMMALTGLRNRLVHLYDEVDDERVHSALAEGLADFDAFARAIASLIE